MKVLIKGIALAAIFLLNGANMSRLRGLPATPKAGDLSDHFGTEPVLNIYGPKAVGINRLAREGITGEDTPITPITNFNKEINPSAVVSGDLDNTSYDASKIIKPEIAAPKFDIKSTIVHEAVVKTPVHLGTQYEEKTTQSMNRVTGQLSRKTVTVEKPIIGVMQNVRQVASENQTLVNVKTGQIIDMQEKTSYVGTNPL